MQILRLTAILFFVGFSFASAQNTMIYNYKESGKFAITGKKRLPNSRTQEYFSLIALKSQKSVHDMQTKFNYEYELKLIRNIEKLRIIAEMSSLDLRNDIIIQGFPVNKYLHPKKANCKIQWLDEDDNLLKEFAFHDVEVHKKFTKLAGYTFVDSLRLPKRYKLKLVEVQGYYDEANLEDLRKVIRAIDMYYDADARASMIMEEVKDLELDNIEILDEYKETIEKLDNFLRNVATRKFEIKLKYPIYDPNDLNTKIASLSTLNNNIQASMKKMKNFVHEAYYKRGIAYLEEKDTIQAESYLMRSYNVKDDYPPTLHELALLNYQKPNLDSSFYFINKIIYRSNADQQMTNKTLALANDVFKGYSALVNANINADKIDEANNLLKTKYAQCLEFKKVGCLDIFEADFFKVYNAKFNELNQKILHAIQQGDFVLAEQYADSNLNYLDQNAKYINQPEAYSNAVKSLYYAYIHKSDSLIQKRKPETAYILLSNAERLCNTNPYIACTDSLKQMIQAAVNGKYENLIIDAKAAYENDELERAYALIEEADKFQTKHDLYASEEAKTLYHNINAKYILFSIEKGKKQMAVPDYEKAIHQFEKAQQIIKIHNYDKNTELDSLLILAIEMHSQQLIENAEAFVKGNKMIDANDNISKVNKLAEKYNIEKLNSELSDIDHVIQSQECNNVDLQVEIQLLASQKFNTQQSFLYSFQALTKAQQFSKRYQNCPVDTVLIQEKMDSIKPAAEYQHLLNEVEVLIKEKSYETAIDLYAEARTLYTDNDLQNYGLDDLKLLDYIAASEHLNFVNFCVKYFVVIDEIDHSLNLTYTLYQENYPASWAKNNQVLLGTNLAIRDYERHPTRDPELFITKYVNEDKWFKNLEKAYLKQWKKLN